MPADVGLNRTSAVHVCSTVPPQFQLVIAKSLPFASVAVVGDASCGSLIVRVSEIPASEPAGAVPKSVGGVIEAVPTPARSMGPVSPEVVAIRRLATDAPNRVGAK